ncbi:hypothetical protein HPB50_025387 [Hyalomma asiaticum]|uniref:Uncharacterized protein n=1 Tax=Hyalomma asiaticum TaxID=266040 RepID=A0ACB7TR04_HYAAI|nr:hypothetical protein HPB50_025387 [Hyalomma asiaticum]
MHDEAPSTGVVYHQPVSLYVRLEDRPEYILSQQRDVRKPVVFGEQQSRGKAASGESGRIGTPFTQREATETRIGRHCTRRWTGFASRLGERHMRGPVHTDTRCVVRPIRHPATPTSSLHWRSVVPPLARGPRPARRRRRTTWKRRLRRPLRERHGAQEGPQGRHVWVTGPA